MFCPFRYLQTKDSVHEALCGRFIMSLNIWKIHFDFQLFDICGRHRYLIYDFMNKVP